MVTEVMNSIWDNLCVWVYVCVYIYIYLYKAWKYNWRYSIWSQVWKGKKNYREKRKRLKNLRT